MSSFVRFVLKHKRFDTPIGDLARDMRDDECTNRSWCYKTFKAHIEEHHNPSRNVMAVVEEAYDLHKKYQENLYKNKKTTS
jgi:hypothetical protein